MVSQILPAEPYFYNMGDPIRILINSRDWGTMINHYYVADEQLIQDEKGYVKDSPYGSYIDPFFVKMKRTCTIEMQDSTGKVLWTKDIVYPDMNVSGYDNKWSNYQNGNPDAPLTIGKCIMTDGTVALADTLGKRYYLMNKDGNKTYLPEGTLGMVFEGKIGGKYWVLSYFMGGGSYYDTTPRQTYFPYKRGLALFNLNGSLYKLVDLTKTGEINDWVISPDCTKILIKPQNYDYGQLILLTLEGKEITKYLYKETDNSYSDKIGWGQYSDLYYISYYDSINIWDASNGKLYAIIPNRSGQEHYHMRIVGLSDKKSGIAFVSDGNHLFIFNYIENQLLAIITYLSGDEQVEVTKPDASEFKLISYWRKRTFKLP
jgi:hypothetical protein